MEPSLPINKDKTNVVWFHSENKTIPDNFDCMDTEVMPNKVVQMVQFPGLLMD